MFICLFLSCNSNVVAKLTDFSEAKVITYVTSETPKGEVIFMRSPERSRSSSSSSASSSTSEMERSNSRPKHYAKPNVMEEVKTSELSLLTRRERDFKDNFKARYWAGNQNIVMVYSEEEELNGGLSIIDKGSTSKYVAFKKPRYQGTLFVKLMCVKKFGEDYGPFTGYLLDFNCVKTEKEMEELTEGPDLVISNEIASKPLESMQLLTQGGFRPSIDFCILKDMNDDIKKRITILDDEKIISNSEFATDLALAKTKIKDINRSSFNEDRKKIVIEMNRIEEVNENLKEELALLNSGYSSNNNSSSSSSSSGSSQGSIDQKSVIEIETEIKENTKRRRELEKELNSEAYLAEARRLLDKRDGLLRIANQEVSNLEKQIKREVYKEKVKLEKKEHDIIYLVDKRSASSSPSNLKILGLNRKEYVGIGYKYLAFKSDNDLCLIKILGISEDGVYKLSNKDIYHFDYSDECARNRAVFGLPSVPVISSEIIDLTNIPRRELGGNAKRISANRPNGRSLNFGDENGSLFSSAARSLNFEDDNDVNLSPNPLKRHKG